MKEIEHKFLVNEDAWKSVDKGVPYRIVQGFIFNSKEKSIRIRIKDKKAFLTIKGQTIGITREEFEYPIPLNDAEKILDSLERKIIKDRYEVKYGNHLWEVDVFKGNLEGLILAELEVKSENEKFEIPNWVTKDVSTDPAYYNAVLINNQ